MLNAKRTTVYLNPKLHRALKLKAVQYNVSISILVNDALKYSLREDRQDLQAIKDRFQDPTRSFEAALKDLKRDGLL